VVNIPVPGLHRVCLVKLVNIRQVVLLHVLRVQLENLRMPQALVLVVRVPLVNIAQMEHYRVYYVKPEDINPIVDKQVVHNVLSANIQLWEQIDVYYVPKVIINPAPVQVVVRRVPQEPTHREQEILFVLYVRLVVQTVIMDKVDVAHATLENMLSLVHILVLCVLPGNIQQRAHLLV
jgi:hypothetical protein